MVIIGAHLLGVILIGGGKDLVRCYIPQFMPRNSLSCNLQKKGNFRFSVIFMAIVDVRIFSCMAVTSLVNLKTHVCSHSLCLRSVHFSFTIIQDSETKNQKSQQPEWRCSTK